MDFAIRFHGDWRIFGAMLKDIDSVYTFSMHCESNFPLKKQQSDLDIGLKRNLGDNDYLKELSSTLEKLENRNIDIVFFQITNFNYIKLIFKTMEIYLSWYR